MKPLLQQPLLQQQAKQIAADVGKDSPLAIGSRTPPYPKSHSRYDLNRSTHPKS